jgi:hypothetical protein
MEDLDKLGPLAALVGTWEGDGGLDVSYHHDDGAVGDTSYRERITFGAFGPVDNGRQHLYGLDYRMSAWRAGEEDPFHTEVGYWLWDADADEVTRCFAVPRSTTIVAGGRVAADATSFTLRAEAGSRNYGILENMYLSENASTTAYEVSVTVENDVLTYDETTTLDMKEIDGLLAHTDRNVLRRVD